MRQPKSLEFLATSEQLRLFDKDRRKRRTIADAIDAMHQDRIGEVNPEDKRQSLYLPCSYNRETNAASVFPLGPGQKASGPS